MKFNAKQFPVSHPKHPGLWAVWKGTRQFWPSTLTDSKHEAEQSAALKSAEWHLEEARALVSKLDGTLEAHAVQGVGAQANDICEQVVDWCAEHWEDHDEMDQRSWTC